MEINGREVDRRALEEIAFGDTDYDHNRVHFETRMTEADLRNIEKTGDTYMNISSTRDASMLKKMASEHAAALLKIADIMEQADVKDDDGDHSDHEDIQLHEYKGDVYVKDDRTKHEEKFDSWRAAVEYVMSLHGDERFMEGDASAEADRDAEDHHKDDEDRHEDHADHREDDKHKREDDEWDDKDTEDAKRKANIIRNVYGKSASAKTAKNPFEVK